MIHINQWAQRHNILPEAMKDLRELMGVDDTPSSCEGVSEAAVQQRVRLAESAKGNRLWRNNVGACEDINGRMIRYGLGNDSHQVNKVFKSSDLVGITPYVVAPADVGSQLGIFTAIEVKRQAWMYKGTGREVAQFSWLKLIISMGGIGRFSTGG